MMKVHNQLLKIKRRAVKLHYLPLCKEKTTVQKGRSNILKNRHKLKITLKLNLQNLSLSKIFAINKKK